MSVLENGVFEEVHRGRQHLGGEDFDQRLVNPSWTEFRRKHGKDITGNARALRFAPERVRRASAAVSTAQATIEIDSLHEAIFTPRARGEFEELCARSRACMAPVERTLLDAKLDKRAVDEIVLVGARRGSRRSRRCSRTSSAGSS